LRLAAPAPVPYGWAVASPSVCVVFGARNVGRAVVAERLAAGWRTLAVARSEETLERLRAAHPDAVTLRGDAADPLDVAAALDRAEELGGSRLVPPTDLPGEFGRFAILADPDGNQVGLWA
jgi:NAD(P)-dependent dehydrogenase (short-subunit alcohol dehydrogenase family)